jgi:phage tail sheath protein FI
MGPVIIGRSERGPGLRPVKIDSFSQFIEVFGEPIPGGQSGDVWRDGNYTAPTYAAYAAQAYLKNAGPITFVRLLGADHSNNAASSVKAGWSLAAQSKDTVAPFPGDATGTGGAYGLVLMKAAGAADWVSSTSCLAAVFYVPHDAAGYRLALSGLAMNGTDYADGLNPAGPGTSSTSVWIKAKAGTQFEMVLRKEQTTASVVKRFNFDFSATSAKSLRKVFNTNPTSTNSNIVSSPERYWLGETFDRKIAEVLSASGAEEYAAALIPLGGATVNVADQNRSAQPGSTPWIFSQYTGATNDDASLTDALTGDISLDVENLFRFHGLHNGDWESKNLKVSITDVKAPTNDFNKYGTFTVEVRMASDTDGSKRVVESFSGLNLNPTSPDYIARRIGDKYSVWNDSERRYVEYGQYDNASNYFRVEVASPIAEGTADPALLPMGFYGPEKYRDMVYVSDTALAAIDSGTPILQWVPGNIPLAHGGGDEAISDDGLGAGAITTTIQIPTHVLRTTSVDALLSDPTDAYFGITTEQSSSNKAAEDYADLVRPLSESTGLSSAYKQFGFIFTLEDVFKGSAADGYPVTHSAGTRDRSTYETDLAAWIAAGSPPAPAAEYTTKEASFAALSINGQADSHTAVLDEGFDSFTVPVQGGFNGVDITERDPFRNTALSGEGELTHYAYNSTKRAIDAAADPEVVECNLMSLPGITNASLTNHLIRVCESRGDALAVVDLENDYVPDHENTSDETSRLPSVDQAITSLKARGLNSSYGCAYFPWVQLRDLSKGQLIWAPPSVAALGTMASSAENTELWFAPAGFTRGGLSEGAAGIPVVGVRTKLTSKERDKLYDVNINPIASFPSEGIVIFGQKTLQVTPSALDRINVRRLMIFLKKEVSRMAATVLFDQNVKTTWARFTSKVNPFLASVKSRFGLTEYRLILDETTTTPELVDRNVMYAKILLKPARAIEYIAIDFVITDSGASFAD